MLPNGLTNALVKWAPCKDGVIQEQQQETENDNMNIFKFGLFSLQATNNLNLQSFPTYILRTATQTPQAISPSQTPPYPHTFPRS